MDGDEALVEHGYLQHLSDADLRLLSAGLPGLSSSVDPRAAILGHRGGIVHLLGRKEAFDLVFAPGDDARELSAASPFLVFALAVERAREELATASYVEEWLGPRRRMPVFDVAPLRELLGDAAHRLFLAELLASYTKVSSGSFLVATRRGLRRQRFSELDPVRLAGLLEVVPEQEHPGVYRRLGDLALFLTGVFPDYTAAHGLSAIEEGRLLRSARVGRRGEGHAIPGFGDSSAVELLEDLGRRWYRLAYELVPPPAPRSLRVVRELAERFDVARRVLNVLTDRFLFPYRSRFFDAAGA